MVNQPANLKIPPQNLEAEMALLGSMMLRDDAIYEVIDIVLPNSFYSKKHKIVFESILDLFKKNNPIDLLSVSSRLAERNQIDEIGGRSYLTELLNGVPTSINIRHYAEIVRKKHLMRCLIEASEHISNLGYDEASELEEILEKAEKKIFEITSSGSTFKFTELKNELEEAWERLDKLHNSQADIRGIPTGFSDIDHKLAGLQKSDLIILAARPSMGKTSLALDIARQTAVRHGNAVGIFSLEMAAQQLVDRMLAAEANVDAWKLRTGKLSREEDFASIRQSLDKLSQAPIYIDDQPGNNILKMRAVARRLKAEKNLKLLIVDYLQLMMPTSSRSNDNLVQQVTEISRSLKNLARELDIPVLALSQLSRAVESRGGRPRLSDLRDSGCLAGDTLLTRADTGERVKIVDLAGQTNIPIHTLNNNWQIETGIISKIFKSGRKAVYRLTTRSGFVIKASGNHPFQRLDDWIRLDQLKVGDRIATPASLNISTPKNSLSDDEIVLLAHLLGDGCVLPRQPYHYTSADKKNIEIVAETAQRLFDIKPKIVRQKNWWHVYLPSPYRLTHGKYHPITNWFNKLGIERVRSYDKEIPETIFSLTSDKIALFLKHLWATDGNISLKPLRNQNTQCSIYYASTSYKIADAVKHLLLRFGIRSKISQNRKSNYRICYNVSIYSKEHQLNFFEFIGCYGERGEKIPKLITKLEKINKNTNIDTWPKEIWNLIIDPIRKENKLSWRDFSHEMNISYNGTALLKNGIGQVRLQKIAQIMSSEKLLQMAESNIFWDEVASIEKLGVEDVYDATVPGTHNFLANGLIVHNSIEQDADVVMFIHREDRYKEESDRTNIAEILIEKHRNGETGKVELYFNDKKATFQSIDKSGFSGAEKEFEDF